MPLWVADHGAETLIIRVIRAQGVAMGEEHRLAVDLDRAGVCEHSGTGHACERLAQEEVTIPAHHPHWHAVFHQGAHRRDDRLVGADRVIPDPGLEQVAKDVEGPGVARLPREEVQEQAHDCRPCGIQVQIGDEQDGRVVTVVLWPRHA